MKRTAGSIIFIIAAAFALAALSAAWPETALAQCPLCRTALTNAGQRAARAMDLAIVVLLIPPVSIFCAIFAVVYRKAKGGEEDKEQ